MDKAPFQSRPFTKEDFVREKKPGDRVDSSNPAPLTVTTTDHKYPPKYWSPSTEAKNNIQAPGETKNSKVDSCKKCIGMTVLAIIFAVLPLTMAVVGVVFRNECPTEYYIPEMLMGGAVILILIAVFQIELRIHPRLAAMFITLSIFCYVTLLAGYVAAAVIIYKIYLPGQTDLNSTLYCQSTLYWFTFWTVVNFPIPLIIIFGVIVATIIHATADRVPANLPAKPVPGTVNEKFHP